MGLQRVTCQQKNTNSISSEKNESTASLNAVIVAWCCAIEAPAARNKRDDMDEARNTLDGALVAGGARRQGGGGGGGDPTVVGSSA